MHPKQEIRRLNSIRAIAVMIVVLSHYTNESGIWGGLLGQGAGQLGVMLFFLLSAFLMAHLYFDSSPTAENLKKFAVARIARVLPLFLFVILLSFIVYQLPPSGVQHYFYAIPDTASLVSHLLLLSGASVLWSIPPEIYFYVVFACLWVGRSKFGRAIAVVPVTLLLFSFFVPPQKAPETMLFGLYVKLSVLQVYPYFCAGFLLGWLYNHWHAPSFLSHHVFVVALAAIPLLYPNVLITLMGVTHGLWSDPRLLVSITIIFFVIVFFVPANNWFLENPVGDFVGKISYSIYLLHYPVLLFLKDLGFTQNAFGFLAFIAVTLFVSTISYKYLEVPARSWIKSRAPV